MWQLLRAELAYYRRVLLTAWSIALAVAVCLTLLVGVLGDKDEDESLLILLGFLPGLFLMVASMISAFIAVGGTSEEKRLYLHMMLPVPVRRVAATVVLLPEILVLIGIAVFEAWFVTAALIAGQPPTGSWWRPLQIGSLLMIVVQFPTLFTSLDAAQRDRGRWIPWLVMVAAIVGMFLIQSMEIAWLETLLALALAAGMVLINLPLVASRRDFTK